MDTPSCDETSKGSWVTDRTQVSMANELQLTEQSLFCTAL